jgi:hypothetical protein
LPRSRACSTCSAPSTGGRPSFAASQLLVICVPIALKIVEWAAIGIVAILAIGALIYLFRERP